MKKIFLVLVVAIVACVMVFASQHQSCVETSVQSLVEPVSADGFRRIELQHLPHAVLRTMGTYDGCRFEGAYVAGVTGAEKYKLLVQKENECTKQFVIMNNKGEVVE